LKLEAGNKLTLTTQDGELVHVTRQHAAAPGLFRARRRGKTVFLTFEWFDKRTGTLDNVYIGVIDFRGRKT
jgi:hypothetical protein